MNLSEPTQVITPTLDGPVVMALARATAPLTGSAVHGLTRRGSRDGVRLTLQRLSRQGIVEVRRHGGALVYALNRRHLGAEAIIELATLTSRVIDQIRDDIERWSIAPIHASLYGSITRGDANEESDVDILIVRSGDLDEMDENWNRQLGILKVSVFTWSGNELQIVERSPAELVAELDTSFVANLRNESLHLTGERLERLLASGGSNVSA